MAIFDFKSAVPVTSGVTTNNFWFGAASQAAATPEIYSMGALTTFLATSTLAAGTITTSQPLTLTQTWNNAAVAFRGLYINITDTAEAVASSPFAITVDGITDALFFNKGPGAFGSPYGLGITGTNVNGFVVFPSAVRLGANTSLCWTEIGIAPSSWGNTADLVLARDAANVLAQRNSTNAQAFRVYNTFTDTNNGEWFSVRWAGNLAIIGTQANGSGTNRTLVWEGAEQYFNTGGVSRFLINSSGNFLANTDNTYDIGASGANRPKDGYFSGTVSAANFTLLGGGAFQGQSNSLFYWTSRSVLSSSADGVIALTNNAQNDFNRLQFGGTSSSFPALKRSSTTLQVRLADDSADADITANTVNGINGIYISNSNTRLTQGAGNATQLHTGASSAYLAVGNGSPEGVVTAPAGSIYLNTAGGTDTSLYTKGSGSGNTGWIAVDNV